MQQSFEDHKRIANSPSSSRRTIYICLLENPFPEPAILSTVQNYIHAFFRLPVRITHVSLEKLRLTTRRGRSGFGDTQLSMDDLLASLKQRVPQDAYGIIAMTTIDFFVPGNTSWEYIPGRSHYTQRHGACSFARLGSQTDRIFTPCDRGTFVRRCLKLSCHEVAHMFGLKHCSDQLCRMAGTMSLEHHDATCLFFCSDCEQKLRALLRWSQKDLAERRQALAEVLNNLEVKEEFSAEIQELQEITTYATGICQPCEEMQLNRKQSRIVGRALSHRLSNITI
eukprot:gnl/MRDRNA2_/MRDRNA2_15523_c0_seq1.p1 gnl/MRDRNA2_/MRDRNA2_15523_c0~~gnl/MRDRNA2_/MRDRNA2_15523_c0_seq1.p1  ORF type:complete len:282 (-),score=39.55 gnl/MRDRNA2_/MRDRNA2_15523_c0_seq1:239-1084(-)